ncbi:MAG: FtsX-like permease family protein [Vicinamibacterales bacterium]|nr:FtsX-like permease family protein [Vicinamibacterales bacterium]
MTFGTLLRRSLTHFWRTNLAVIAGVGVAVSVLAGAFLVGTSVRASLHDLALLRLGRVDHVVTSGLFFREALADELLASGGVEVAATDAAPLIALEGFATHQESGSRAGGIQVYGVDERFWAFHGFEAGGRVPEPGAVLVSSGLARELGAAVDETLLVRVQKPSAIPVESLHGRRDDLGETMRLRIQQVLASDELGEFSFRPQQGLARAVFVSLGRMQRDLGLDRQANTMLLGSGGAGTAIEDTSAAVTAIETALRAETRLEDLGVRVRVLGGPGALVVESAAGLLGDDTVMAARSAAAETGMADHPILTYLANEIRLGDRSTPYSLVTALDLEALELDDVDIFAAGTGPPPIVLNSWTADDLQAAPGDIVSVQYFRWADAGALLTEEAEFLVAGVVPLEGLALDRDFAPEYPGITEATDVSDWDPPFPIDLDLVRPKDEAYWDEYRTAAKGFLPLGAGQELWRSRWGQVTSLRVVPATGPLEAVAETYSAALRSALDPLAAGFVVYPARGLALEAAVGVTDFGEYFTYFSFFLVVSALLLASLFFRLGVEQRLAEIGALRALGFDQTRVRRLFWAEGAALSFAGSLLGVLGAVGYADLIMWGLRTWWVDAVGTTLLTLHVSAAALGAGVAGGMLAAFVSIAWTLRAVAAATPRALISGSLPDTVGGRGQNARGAGLAKRAPTALGLAGALVLAATLAGFIGDTAGFFGAGLLFLAALLTLAWVLLGQQDRGGVAAPTAWSVSQVGIRNATARPGRSVLCITLIAFAAFIIVAVDAFHREGGEATSDPASGTGGYPLLAESLLPIVLDLSSEDGRAELGVSAVDDDVFAGTAYTRFRVRPGEDASCLNLYQAKDPRLLAPDMAFVEQGRFGFGRTLAQTEAESANPWLLLDRVFDDGAVPAIADATSLAYALHLSVGDDFILNRDSDNPIRLRIVAALSDSIFQRELIIGEPHFARLFPEHEGYRFFLVDASFDEIAEVTAALEDRLADFGFDVTSAPERLAAFHRVENTYLATFQTLGALGLLLGTFGLGAVLLRNVLERRRELALLRAVGYDTGHVSLMVLVENGLLLFGGLGVGTLCALVAIAPAWIERGGQFPIVTLGGLLLAVAMAGLVSSLAATAVAVKSPLLAALRSE